VRTPDTGHTEIIDLNCNSVRDVEKILEVINAIILDARGAPPRLARARRSAFGGRPSGAWRGPQALAIHKLEILVIPLNPVQRSRRILVDSGVVADVTDAEPEGNLRVAPHDAANRLEIRVDVA
jgi:hypothetical protein